MDTPVDKKMDVVKVFQWIVATMAISVTTVFGMMKFAYSDFETQRTTDIYHGQLEKRLDNIQVQLVEINRKIDRIHSD
jgi:hypothetical protein